MPKPWGSSGSNCTANGKFSGEPVNPAPRNPWGGLCSQAMARSGKGCLALNDHDFTGKQVDDGLTGSRAWIDREGITASGGYGKLDGAPGP